VKKVFCVFMAVIMCFGTFSACSKQNTQNSTSTAPATTAVTTVAVTTELTSAETTTETPTTKATELINEQQARKTATEFLNYLKIKDVDKICALIGAGTRNSFSGELVVNAAPYSFFSKIDVKSYEIIETIPCDGYMRYKVNLDISKSGSDFFPAGKSTWILEVIDPIFDKAPIQMFRNISNSISIVTWEKQSDVVNFCYWFSEIFDCYKSVNDFNELVPSPQKTDSFNSFCYGLIFFLSIDNYYCKLYNVELVSRKKIETDAKTAFGITTVDLKKFGGYDKKNDSITIGGDGYAAFWTISSLSSELFNSKTQQYIVTIDYYSDEAYVLKAKTIQYIVRKNADTSLTLLSTKVLFDTGAGLAGR